jgi:hypothetical protein
MTPAKLIISRRSHQEENTPNQEEPARKKQEEITRPSTAKEGYRPHTSHQDIVSAIHPEGVIVAGTAGVIVVSTMKE